MAPDVAGSTPVTHPIPGRVRRILDERGTLVFPGVYDTLSAKIAEQAGFPLAFISGYAVSATLIGEPDMGLLTQTEIVERARQICGAVTWPKRCGHMHDKQVVAGEAWLQKIRAAVDTRGDRDFFIVARTDALAAIGLEEALARVEAAREAGADATFVEAPESLDDLREIGRRAPRPTVANMVEQGRTPMLGRSELSALGFDLILYPVAGLYASAQALTAVYGHLHGTGTTRGADRPIAFDRFNELIGVDESRALAARFEESSG